MPKAKRKTKGFIKDGILILSSGLLLSLIFIILVISNFIQGPKISQSNKPIPLSASSAAASSNDVDKNINIIEKANLSDVPKEKIDSLFSNLK